MTRIPRRRSQDDGASLALVMVFIMGVGLVTGALLSYSQSAITSASATAARQRASVDTAGALDTAINNLRFTSYTDPAAACPIDNLRIPTSPGSTASQMAIDCGGVAGTGAAGALVPITARNRPGSALLTLGTGGEHGLDKGSNGILTIKGRVYVNSDVAVSGTACPGVNCSQVTVVDAPATARTGCTAGRVVTTSTTATTYPVDCTSTANPPEGLDPALLTDALVPADPATGYPGGTTVAAGYAQPPSAPSDLPLRVVPSTCPAGNPVYFDPGYYDNAGALNNLMGGGCSRTYVFRPGVYYFDFRDEEVSALAAANRPFTPATTNVWSITDPNTYVIGGTLTAVTLPPSIPGSCISPLTTTASGQGVQFVFGGSSRLSVSGGKVELCGQYDAGRPPLVLYGAKTGATTSQGPTDRSAGTATGQATGGVVYTPASGASAATELAGTGSGSAVAVITRDASTTLPATWRLSAFAPGIPAGSILTQADVEVRHKETSFRNGDGYTLDLLPNPARPGATVSDTTSITASNGAAHVSQTATFRSALAQEVWRYGLSDARIDLKAVAAKRQGANTSLTADVDSVVLRVSWLPPSLRGQTTAVNGANCVGAVAGCALVTTAGSQTRAYFQGTAYAPRAKYDISLTNVSGQVFRSGIIARALSLAVTASSSYSGPVIEVPDDSVTGVSLESNITAYSCPVPLVSGACGGAADPPGGSWRVAGRARVAFGSAYPAPTNGSRAVTVLRWQLG